MVTLRISAEEAKIVEYVLKKTYYDLEEDEDGRFTTTEDLIMSMGASRYADIGSVINKIKKEL